MQQTAAPLSVNKIPAAQRDLRTCWAELSQAKGQRYPGPPYKEPMRPSSATDNNQPPATGFWPSRAPQLHVEVSRVQAGDPERGAEAPRVPVSSHKHAAQPEEVMRQEARHRAGTS